MLEYVPILVEHKAHVNAVDSEGKVPLNYLADRPESAAKDIEQLLLANGGKYTWKY